MHKFREKNKTVANYLRVCIKCHMSDVYLSTLENGNECPGDKVTKLQDAKDMLIYRLKENKKGIMEWLERFYPEYGRAVIEERKVDVLRLQGNYSSAISKISKLDSAIDLLKDLV